MSPFLSFQYETESKKQTTKENVNWTSVSVLRHMFVNCHISIPWVQSFAFKHPWNFTFLTIYLGTFFAFVLFFHSKYEKKQMLFEDHGHFIGGKYGKYGIIFCSFIFYFLVFNLFLYLLKTGLTVSSELWVFYQMHNLINTQSFIEHFEWINHPSN